MSNPAVVPMFFFQTIPSQISVIHLLAQPVGGSPFLCVAAEYLGVRGKKGIGCGVARSLKACLLSSELELLQLSMY